MSASRIGSFNPGTSDFGTSDNTDFVQPGETTLAQVATRMGVDLNSLLQANPQIKDPNNLSPQWIHRPLTSSAESAHDSDNSTQSVPTDLPKAPMGDPLAASAFKAKLANMDGTDRTCPGVNACVNYQGSPEFQALPAATRNKLLQEAANDPSVEMRLDQIMQQPEYGNLSTKQRTELLNVFASANPQGREELVTLMNRQLPSG